MRRLLPLLVACVLLAADAGQAVPACPPVPASARPPETVPAAAPMPAPAPSPTPAPAPVTGTGAVILAGRPGTESGTAPGTEAGTARAIAGPAAVVTVAAAPARVPLARAEKRESETILPPRGRIAAVGNPLYAVAKARGGCRVPAIRAGRWPSAEKYMEAVASCLDRVWARQFALARIYYTLPPRRFVRHRVRDRDCGLMPAKGAKGTYCDQTRTFYVIVERYDLHPAAAADLAEVVAHEYGHHVQNMAYISDYMGEAYDDAGSLAKRDTVNRRLELQAECFAGVGIGALRRSMPSWPLFRSIYQGTISDRAVQDHGAMPTQLRWLQKGYRSARAGACDTWSPPKREVT
ncbi:neutral zinc metallopeptidase [Sphaerisporangium rhizosphaerae]|uniref:Neutral zinc metallopeptidase n=1 Tax=Sphaerisporangium rhizosphaerae TaxID=2269375 RepID=A0ABW2PHX4_9ACTN